MNIIKNIYWERTNLIIEFDEIEKDKEIYLTKGKEKIELLCQNNKVKILLINTPEGMLLPEGKWKISNSIEQLEDLENLNNIFIDEPLVSKLDDFSRVFKYKANNYAYIVTFSINENKELYIHTQFMMRNKNPKRIRPLFESKRLKKRIKSIVQIVSLWFANIIYRVAHFVIPNKKKSVLFLSENGDELIGNALAFYNYLSSKDEYKIKKYCKNVFINKLTYFERLKQILKIASCNYIILDNYTPLLTYLNVSKNVKIVQLWHAGVGFKAVGYARFGLKGSPHPYKSGHRKYDLAIVDDESLIEVYEEVFGISKSKFIAAGMPRLEDYLDSEKINSKVNEFYNNNKELKDRKIILFAPTYRGTGQTTAYYDMDLINQDKLAEFCKKNNFVVIFKFHPFINNELEIKEEYKDIFYNYTLGYDINELMYVSDVLVTDYSSCAYEYSLFDRPIIFYRYDKVLYEYIRRIHTKDVFSKETFEALNFDELMEDLEKISNKPKCNPEKDKKKIRSTNSCSMIEKEIFKEE